MDLLRSVFHHLVLPPQLPGVQDSDIEAVSHDILKRLIYACGAVDKLVDAPWSKAFQSVRASLDACLALNAGRLDKSTMLEHFGRLERKHMLILYVVEQNAALLVRHDTCDGQQCLIFEAFETSAASEKVLAADHALQWDFPGCSAQMPLDEFENMPFQESLAAFLEQASMEPLHGLQASTRKAEVSVTETRDATDPALVTQMLMPLLEAKGSHFRVPVLRKRVRDEINIRGDALPWRRLPFWLVLRVAAQRQLSLMLGKEQGRLGYKFLMGVLLSQLLQESAGKLSPELTMTLQAKLCRRIAKLEMDKTKIEPSNAEISEPLFIQIGPMIKAIVKEATVQVEAVWESFKQKTTPPIPKLPPHAPEYALQISLPNSGKYLKSLLSNPQMRQADLASASLPEPLDKGVKQSQVFTDDIFRLAAWESLVDDENQSDLGLDCEGRCLRSAEKVSQVLALFGKPYDSDPEHVSAMLLMLFTLWVRLDKCAVEAWPPLRDYRPVFSPELLDVLQLPTMSAMRRLQDLQTYLDQRQSNCRYGTILDNLDEDCLAARYVAQSPVMQTLGTCIQEASDQKRRAKEAEWKQQCEAYDHHTVEMSNDMCRCSWSNGRRNDVRDCTKCWHGRVRKRMKIQIQEAFLPSSNPARAAMLFELAIPNYLAAYRNVTWRILSALAHPFRGKISPKPKIELQDCRPLRPWMTADMKGISLASPIKCFTQTHFMFRVGKCPLSDVLLPFGARFELYDHSSKLWVKDLNKPLTLQHLCGIHIPQGLRATVLPAMQHPPPIVDGPSSYEIQANQTECPSDLSVHEFTAYQKLLAGELRRWPNILVEMGSSNLNLSSEDAARVLGQLAVQAGPQLQGDVLRAVHVIFQEPVFLERLVEVIEKRLHSLLTNWREHNCMELLITLSLRLWFLSTGIVKNRAVALLESARNATLEWTTRLRKEVRTAVDGDAAERAATYGFYAALLCRRTFAIYVELKQAMSREDLTTWAQASMALQENLLVDIDALPPISKSMLVRDAKMAYQIQPLLRNAIQAHPASIGDAIVQSWSDSSASDEIATIFSPWSFLQSPHDRWITATASKAQERFACSQRVHYNIIEGHLLVDGQPRGKLPLEIRNSEAVKDMFGTQYLVAYPSSMPGMTHRLATLVHGQEVHFGLQGEQIVIRALTKNGLLEFVPKSIFSGSGNFDLPAELVDNCAHWLNLRTACLEVRRKPAIWTKRPRDWAVDISGRRATRGSVDLVDPQSDIFAQVAEIFRDFERPEKLTVYQPRASGGRFSVDLRHLDLSFYVNKAGRFICRQHKAEVDPNQDAGTWHGFRSKLVLRDVVSGTRSIVVPLGLPKCQRRGVHVDVRIDDAQECGTYQIDEVLGRLSCPPEPRLLYIKALYHAVTSFCLPDTLTKRTGTEEAFHILRSGAAQPWGPLGDSIHPVLNMLKTLPPNREYYPPEIKRLQKVQWDKNMTVTIQHDGYEPLVQAIMSKSNRLGKFAEIVAADFCLNQLSHLRYRGERRRRLYERPTYNAPHQAADDLVYVPRDRRVDTRASHVYEISRLVTERCSSLHMSRPLMSALESYAVIGGFHENDDSSAHGSLLMNQIEDPINEAWGDLVNFCRHVDDQAPLLFRLGLLAFGPKPDMNVIRSLFAFAFIDGLRSLQAPSHSSFRNFKSRGRPSLQSLQELIIPAHLPFGPEYFSGCGERDRKGHNAQEYKELCEEDTRRLASHVLELWPTPAAELSISGFETDVLNVAMAIDKLTPEWERRRINSELEGYIRQVQKVLDSLNGPRDASVLLEWENREPTFVGVDHGQAIVPMAQDLVVKACHCLDIPTFTIQFKTESTAVRDGALELPETNPLTEAAELEGILARFASSPDTLRQQYGGDLLQSLAALKKTDPMLLADAQVPTPPLEAIMHAKEQAYSVMTYQLQQISAALAANDPRSTWLQLSAAWPCISPTAVLECLRSMNAYEFGNGMKEALVCYGLAITELQRLERMRDALLRHNRRMLDEELCNTGHDNWSPLQLPDWLLMEIDSNLLIRAEQVDVAQAIIAPSSGANSLLQMNMGQGKTSLIVPLVVAYLANRKELSRLLVPKALLMQTAQTTQLRLGGLVGREVRHVPFSRKTQATSEILKLYKELHQETRDLGGLMLTSWENVLSYKLGGWQRLADGKLEIASRMIDFQDWLEENCRDVLDECDVILSVKTQLNYPSGSEMAVDGHPFRWQVAQVLLGLVFDHVPVLQDKFRSSIDVLERPGSFPMLHLGRNAEDALHDRILDDISAGRTTFLRPVGSISSDRRSIIRQALLKQPFDESIFAQAVSAFEDAQTTSKILFTIRGILTSRLLVTCLNKRWNVQYGLHPARHPVAVPFEAKGVPSEQSEFGHPDVSILFTCLAFYYTGLGFQQFQQSLQHVLQSDDPAARYDWWTSGYHTLPEALHHWNTVNVDDGGQMEELWRHLHLNRIVINHYMNHFVFPAHARQFDVKLQASAWDLPLGKERRGTKTTGFSGTNDNRAMLPLTIRQDDLPGLRHTSAEVLSYLLQPRNRGYQVTTDAQGKRLTEAGLLRQVHAKGIRTLIDAGAYILEMDNRTLVQTWLTIDHAAKAAIYFGTDNRAWVHFRGETKSDVPLLATPFADNLGECLVYLDEAHTRGVDLKLPAEAHGALTLALKQTKDYTMQAAMRLRRLRTTQSITLFAPPDVHQSIQDFCRPETNARLDSSHVVSWLLEQTCRANEDLQPLYVAQGLDFCRRTDAVRRHHNFMVDAKEREKLLGVLQQAERQTLEQMYGAASRGSSPVALEDMCAPHLQAFADQLRRSCSQSGPVQAGAWEEVEQEREVQVQVEQVRQVQKPQRYKPLAFPGLHPAVLRFARTGILETTQDGAGFEQAFVYVARSSIGKRYGVRKTESRLFVSEEFGKTVVFVKGAGEVDNFLRPVEWILWSPSTQTALVIIPEEAELLIPNLRLNAEKPTVYLIAYAAPVTKAMVSFNQLRFYTLPRLPFEHTFPEWFRMELGILAGRLYFDKAEWVPMARYLRSSSAVSDNQFEDDAELQPVDKISPATFADDPAPYLLEWVTLRRKTRDVLHTPVGYICTGRTLENGHPLW